tara:strand:+ start:1466 stop:1900 length:435 start_codon:yes stop_codon:yes gene_type:complete
MAFKMKGWSGFQHKSTPAKYKSALKQSRFQPTTQRTSSSENNPSTDQPPTAVIEADADGIYRPDHGALIHTEDFIGDRLHISSDEGDPSKNTGGDAVVPEGLELDTEYKIEFADDFVEGNTGMFEWELDTKTNTIILLSETTEE